MAGISQEQARPLFREDGLSGGIRLFEVMRRRGIRDRDRWHDEGIGVLGLGRTGTDVKKGDAEWTDPRCCEKK